MVSIGVETKSRGGGGGIKERDVSDRKRGGRRGSKKGSRKVHGKSIKKDGTGAGEKKREM